MRKYLFLVYHEDYLEFLRNLRELGILHVRQQPGAPSDVLLQRMQELRDIRDTLHELRHRKVEHSDELELSPTDGLEIVQYYQEFTTRLSQLEQQKNQLLKEISFWKPWGDFSIETVRNLRNAGWQTHFFTCQEKKFREEWTQQFPLQVIRTLNAQVYFVIFSPTGQTPEPDAEEIPPPMESPASLHHKKEQIEKQIAAINRQLDRYAILGLDAVEKALQIAGENTQMVSIIESSRTEMNDSLMLLEGFAPVQKEEVIASLCREKHIPYLSERPSPADSPPILLRNKAFSRLFEPIGQMFSLPAYQELDLTPFFAPFFLLFFGFCLGDAGYGIALWLGATVYKFKARESLKPVLTLAQYLGIATIIMGIVTGTFFGLNLTELEVPWLTKATQYMLQGDQVFQLALVFGGIQILFGLILKSVNQARQFGFVYALSTIGWIILLLSLLDLGLSKIAGTLSTWTAWAGVALILLFNDPKAGILTRLGKGVWELYGVTGVFGDLMSYIRLFALGVSSAILGLVINNISLQILGIPYIGPILFVLFLVVGHTGNLLVATLGAFVHPMRLTFVEFYKNAGFTGGGKPYKPLTQNS